MNMEGVPVFDFLCGPLRNARHPLRLFVTFAALTADANRGLRSERREELKSGHYQHRRSLDRQADRA